MPRTSKIKSPRTRAEKAAKPYVCSRCGREYPQQKRSFLLTNSPLFAKNNRFLPVCAICIDELFGYYTRRLGTPEAAAKRLCMKFDFYWSAKVFDETVKADPDGTVFRTYTSRMNLYRYSGRTFDETVDEDDKALQELKDELEKTKAELADAQQRVPAQPDSNDGGVDEAEQERLKDEQKTLARLAAFWGQGFTDEEYHQLDARYQQWMGELPPGESVGVGAETLYKQICLLENIIAKNAASGKPIESSVNQLNNLIGSVRAKPVQQQSDEGSTPFDTQPFGVGIKMCENTRPIPKPLPEFEDVDGIGRYVSIWFLGHLCKMLHIKNTYSRLYEEEMARLRVERPEVDEEDDEDFLYDIFSDSGDKQ